MWLPELLPNSSHPEANPLSCSMLSTLSYPSPCLGWGVEGSVTRVKNSRNCLASDTDSTSCVILQNLLNLSVP